MPIRKPGRGPVPGDALDYFNAKGLRPAFSYQEVWREEHDTAFTVAKIMERDILSDVQRSLAGALENGTTFEQWSKNTKDLFDRSGWSANNKTRPRPHRLATIFNTNMRVARTVGQWQRIERRKRTHSFLEYNLGPSERHRPVHEDWEGTVLPVDDPFWDLAYPPNGYGCKCFIRQVSRNEAEELGIDDTAPAGEPDPGWDHNPGKGRAERLEAEARR